jgi:hypothetical protein
MFTYLPVSLPLPPAHFIDELLTAENDQTLIWSPEQQKRFQDSNLNSYLNREVQWQNQTYQSRVQKKYLLSDLLVSWIDDHLPKNYTSAALAVSKGSPFQGPHLDAVRHYILYLSLDPGGEEVKTSFWRLPQHPVEFEKASWPTLTKDYPGLEHLESVVLQPNQWYVLNGWIYHSIEDISGTRISLQLDYDKLEITLK